MGEISIVGFDLAKSDFQALFNGYTHSVAEHGATHARHAETAEGPSAPIDEHPALKVLASSRSVSAASQGGIIWTA